MGLPDPEQRYAQLEQLYSSGQWLELDGLVRTWLQELESNEPDSIWRPRIWLLMGHTRLYGFRDSTGAADYYEQVLASSGGQQENLWREIAAAGLADCKGAIQAEFANQAELAELSKGLLRVVIKANDPQQQSPN